jgi:phage gp16-like protein
MSNLAKKPLPPKYKLYAQINIAKKETGISDDNYRLMLEAVTKKDSLKEMSIPELIKVKDHFKSKLGWKNKNKSRTKKAFRPSTDPMVRKCYVLWNILYKRGALNCSKKDQKAALNKFAKKHYDVENVEWLKSDQAVKLIEILKKWLDRTGSSQINGTYL